MNRPHRVVPAVAGLRCTLTLAALLVLLHACGQAPAPSSASSTASRFSYTMEEVPSGFEPLRASTLYASTVVLAVHDTLYRYRYLARPYQLAPNLAAAMPQVSADGLTWTIQLRDGVRFADDPAFPQGRGRLLRADDVVYSLQRHFQPDNASEGAWLWQEWLRGIEAWQAAGANPDTPWEAVVATGPLTLEIRLTKPFPMLAHTLTEGYAAIVAREAVEHYGADLALHPVGSGPFRLASYDGAVARLERNSNYRSEPLDLAAEGFDPERHGALGLTSLDGRAPPFVDQLELRFVADPRLRMLSFERGDTDLTSIASAFQPQVLEQAQPLLLKPAYAKCCHAQLQPLTELVYMAFNFADPHVGRSADPQLDARNHALRCAIVRGYDWQTRNRLFNQGAGQVFPGAVVPATMEFDSTLSATSVSADAAAGQALLAQAGWTAQNLPTLRFASTGGTDMQGVFEHLRSDLVQRLGWPLEKIQWDSFASFGAYNDAINQGGLMLMDVGWRLDYPDALNTLQLFYGPYAPPQVNAGAYRNKQFDALYERAVTMEPGSERTGLARQMNQMLVDDCAFLGGYARSELLVWRKSALVLPDREMLRGHFLKFVARQP